MSVSIVERINNLPYLYRLARSRCNLDSVWDEEWHRDLVLRFVRLAQERRHIDAAQLATIHSDDLTQLFNELNIPVGHRVIIRRYLSILPVATANLWSGLQFMAMAMAAVWRFVGFVGRRTVFAACGGAALGLYVSARRAQLSVLAQTASAALNQPRRHRGQQQPQQPYVDPSHASDGDFTRVPEAWEFDTSVEGAASPAGPRPM
eukprot:CAMPEP_0174827734 /NCGR_PEP_ID=MMETSP1114-20130205/904_1 /TAXON_ID=312471 /ORGANISM="Neobodo designis, Strain CCAP 1951/1" /LENGTH=204 /DNA_ID=CAMNT_0016061411 /DNA_START=29 /DNA_END=643 /DNA_ORIENTATION=+